MDVHVPRAITDQLRSRGADALTAVEDGYAQAPDEHLLTRAAELNRVIFTQDIRFKVLAERWQREEKSFAGLFFGHQLRGTIGQYVRDLEVIALASEPSDWVDTIGHLPF